MREVKPDIVGLYDIKQSLSNLIWDGHYIKVKIDVDRTDKEIKKQILEEIKYARSILEKRIGRAKTYRIGHDDHVVFKVWDLHSQSKTSKDIIKEVWSDEYENESPKDDSNLDKKYKELSIKYRNMGHEDWDEKAYRKAYGNETSSSLIKLFMRVNAKIKRMKEYARSACKNADDPLFPISYEAARVIVAKAGRLVNIKLRPHDRRRHAATYASRSSVPIEVVSKVILRHSNLSTTQLYLGKISETEATSWIDNLYR